MATDTTLLPTPFIVAIDTREQRGYPFASPLTEDDDANDSDIDTPGDGYEFADGITQTRPRRKFKVCTVVATLGSGDYSLIGYEKRIAVERKSLSDFYNTLGQGRARFTRELARLASFEFAAVVIEAEWSVILGQPPARSRLNPRSVIASVLAWQQRWPRVHWWAVPGRAMGEAVTLRILDRFWKEHQRTAKAGAN